MQIRQGHFNIMMDRLKIAESDGLKKGIVDEYMIHANAIDARIRELEEQDKNNKPYINPSSTIHKTVTRKGYKHIGKLKKI